MLFSSSRVCFTRRRLLTFNSRARLQVLKCSLPTTPSLSQSKGERKTTIIPWQVQDTINVTPLVKKVENL